MVDYEQMGYGLRQTSILDELIGRTAKIAVERTESKPTVKNVLFKDPATIIFWTDNTKTVVKCQEGDTYNPEIGFVMCYLKKLLGNDNTFNKMITKWVPEEKDDNPPLTVEELKQMDGQKVWVVDLNGIVLNGWHTVSVLNEKLYDDSCLYWEFGAITRNKCKAYRYKKED